MTTNDTQFDEAMNYFNSIIVLSKEPTEENISFYHRCSDDSYRDVTGNGTKYPKMDDGHLINTIRLLKRSSSDKFKNNINIYIKEAKKRKLEYV